LQLTAVDLYRTSDARPAETSSESAI